MGNCGILSIKPVYIMCRYSQSIGNTLAGLWVNQYPPLPEHQQQMGFLWAPTDCGEIPIRVANRVCDSVKDNNIKFTYFHLAILPIRLWREIMIHSCVPDDVKCGCESITEKCGWLSEAILWSLPNNHFVGARGRVSQVFLGIWPADVFAESLVQFHSLAGNLSIYRRSALLYVLSAKVIYGLRPAHNATRTW